MGWNMGIVQMVKDRLHAVIFDTIMSLSPQLDFVLKSKANKVWTAKQSVLLSIQVHSRSLYARTFKQNLKT